MDKLKLKWKIFGFLLGFCLLLLTILWLFQTVFLSHMYKAIRKKEIDQAIVSVANHINSPDLEEILYQLELSKEIMVRPSHQFIPPSGMGRMGKMGNRGSGRKSPESLTKTQDFILADGQKISLTFYAFITPVDATVSTLKIQLMIISLIMLLLAVLLAILIAKHISRPIEQINESSKNMAKGDYQTNFNAKGFLEIQELSQTLNVTAKELSKVEGYRRELMANISHDLRTPLALIYSYAEMMHDFPHEITPDQTQMIMDESRRLSSLVNDLLDISNLETGTSKPLMAKFNLSQSLEKTIDRIGKLVKDQAYTLDFKYNQEVYVYADEEKIIQAFYNLLLNAITHSGQSRQVTVRQIVTDHQVRVEVIDDGIGIKASDLPYIWERYYKVNQSHQRGIMGTGLGLSIVKEIIQSHGGQYGVESEAGSGSVFYFTLKKI